MEKIVTKKSMIYRITIIFLCAIFLLTYIGNAEVIENQKKIYLSNEFLYKNSTQNGYNDITVEEAWDLLTSTENGVQIPIDVRSEDEWRGERINTSFPEEPKHFWIEDLKTDPGYQEFLLLYEGQEIIIYCKSGGRSASAAQTLVSNGFNGVVYNMFGGITAWKQAGFPTKIGNNPPDVPQVPIGPNVGGIGIEYEFSTIAVDQDDDTIRFGWSWNGDETVEDWTDYYPPLESVTISHIFSAVGIYEILVIAEDNVGDQSDFSSVFTIVITNPPDAPVIKGPTNGKVGVSCNYRFSAVDNDDDKIYLYIDWGDGNTMDWFGPYASNDEVTFVHSFSINGTYTIKAKAKDLNNLEGEWGSLVVNMPKNKNSILVESEKEEDFILFSSINFLFNYIKLFYKSCWLS